MKPCLKNDFKIGYVFVHWYSIFKEHFPKVMMICITQQIQLYNHIAKTIKNICFYQSLPKTARSKPKKTPIFFLAKANGILFSFQRSAWWQNSHSIEPALQCTQLRWCRHDRCCIKFTITQHQPSTGVK